MTAEERVSARRRRIMEAGLDLFHTQGYPRTSIRAVLRHSRLQDRYFAENFASLDELMAEILKEMNQEEFAKCQDVLNRAGTRRDRARGVLDVLARGVTDDPRKGHVKLIESLAAGPLAAKERRRGMRQMADLVESLLREDWPDPGIDITAMSMAVVGGVNQILLNWADGSFEFSREGVVEQAFHLFEAVAEFGGASNRA